MRGNPYVGQRSFERGQRAHFYGREKEARDLSSLIMAERLVLFYAPPGAGKTSLLNARVIPILIQRGFDVLPIVRVGNDIPSDMADRPFRNIFVLSALLDLAEDTHTDLTSLADHTLSSYLQTLCSSDRCRTHPPLLIFDDFEELFTTHQDRWQDIQGFFEQVREALRAIPSLGIVFAMSENYVAELDPYVRLLPKGLRARYRMAGLELDAAREVVLELARASGRIFAPGTVDRLLFALQPGQSEAAQAAAVLYVNSSLLQIVLSRLWEKLPPGQGPITWEDIREYVQLDRALRDFYEEVLVKTQQRTDVDELFLRRWIGEQLITPQQTRKPVPLAKERTAGLPNEAVFFLRDQHFLSEEVRLKRYWYQLSHEQLIPAILASNHDWALKQETPLRTAARQWKDTGDDSLLYRGQALREARDWANKHKQEVLPYELTFLAISEEAEEERLRKQLKLRRNIIAGLVMGALILAVVAGVAFEQAAQARQAEALAREAQHTAEVLQQQAVSAKTVAESAQSEALQLQDKAETARQEAETQRALAEKEAEKQHQIALAAQLAAQANLIREQRAVLLPRSVLLAVESLRRFPSVIGEEALRSGLDLLPRPLSTVRAEAAIEVAKFSPDGRWAAAGDARGNGYVWNTSTGQMVATWSQDAAIHSLAFSADGTKLAAVGADAIVRLISLPEGKVLFQWAVPAPLWDVALSPDGQWLAASAISGDVRLWSVHNGRKIAQLSHPASVWQVAFSPDGRFLATACDDGLTRIWSLGGMLGAQSLSGGGGGALLRPRFELSQGASVAVLAFSPQGLWLATGGDDSSIRLWDLASGHQLTRMTCDAPVVALAFSPEGRRLVSGSLDNTARVWEVPEGVEIALVQHSAEVTAVAFAPDGLTVASAGLDHTARVWNIVPPLVASGLRVEQLARVVQSDAIYSVQFDPTGQRLLTGSADGVARVWELGRTHPRVYTVQRDWINSVAFSPDGTRLVSGSADGTVVVWRKEDGHTVVSMTHSGPVYAVAFSPDGTRVASGGGDGEAVVWDARSGVEISRQTHRGAVLALTFSPNGRTVLSADADGDVRVWDARSGQERQRWLHPGSVWAVAISPDGAMAATGGEDTMVRLWDIRHEREVRRLAHPDAVWTVAFSPDGKKLLTGCADGMARVWDVRSAQVLVRVVHENWVTQVAFSSEGHWCVSGSDDRTARVWNADTGEEIAWLMHRRGVRAVAFSPDDRTIATGSAAGQVRLWLWRPEDLISEACARVERNLTTEEWTRYLPYEPYRPTCASK